MDMRVSWDPVSDELGARTSEDLPVQVDGGAVDVHDEHLPGDRTPVDEERSVGRDVRDLRRVRIRRGLAEQDDAAQVSVPALELHAEEVVTPRQRQVARGFEAGAIEPVR